MAAHAAAGAIAGALAAIVWEGCVMAAPSVSGYTILHPFNTTAKVGAVTPSSNGTLTTVSDGPAAYPNGLSVTHSSFNASFFIRLNFDTPQDFSGKYFSILFGTNGTAAFENWRLLSSAGDLQISSGNYTSSSEVIVEPWWGSSLVSYLGIQAVSKNNNFARVRLFRFDVVDVNGLTLTADDPLNPGTYRNFFDYSRENTLQPADTSQGGIVRLNQNILLPHKLRIGNNDATYFNTLEGSAAWLPDMGPLSSSPQRFYIDLSDSFRTLTIDINAPRNFPGLRITNAGGNFEDVSSAAHEYSGAVLANLASINMGLANVSASFFDNNGSLTASGSIDGSEIIDTPLIWRNNLEVTRTTFQGSPNYFIDLKTANYSNGQTIDLSANFFEGAAVIANVLVDGVTGLTINLSAVDFAAYNTDPANFPIATANGGSFTVTGPVSQIVVSNIPAVAGALIGVVNLTTMASSYPTISSGVANIPTNPETNYLIAVDAPGWVRQQVILSGSTPAFALDWSGRDFRYLYDQGNPSYVGTTIDYNTFEVLVDDSLTAVDPATAFRRIEDLLANQQAIFFPNPPSPLVVQLSASVAEYYLVFPYDNENQVVNPVVIRPHPDNTVDVSFVGFSILLREAENPFYDIFDFTQQPNGRIIRIETKSTYVLNQVTGGGGTGLGPEDIARLERIEQQLVADISKGAERYQRFLPGTSTVILDKDVSYDPVTGFTLTEHQEPPP